MEVWNLHLKVLHQSLGILVLFDFLDLGRCSRLFRYHLPYSLDLVLVVLIVGKLVFPRLLFYNRRRFLLGSLFLCS